MISTASSDPEPTEVDGWRRTLWALWAAQTVALVAFSMRTPFLPFYLGDLGAGEAPRAWWASAIAAGGALTSAVTAPFWGVLADRVGRKPMVLRALVCGGVTVGLMAAATAPWQLFGLRLVEGATTGTVAACAALIAATVPERRLGFSLGLMQTSVFSGGAVGPLLGGFVAGWVGYRSTYGLCGALILVAALVAALAVQERFDRPAPRRAGETWRARWAVLLVPVVVLLVVVMFAIRAASQAMLPILPLFVSGFDHGGLTDAEATGLVFGVQGVASAVASLALGGLSDRFGRLRVLILSLLVAGIVYLPMALATDTWQLVVLQGLFGLAAGGLIPTTNALLATATDPTRRGAVFGLMTMAGSLGTLVGPLAATGVATTAGYGAAFVATGATLLVTAAAVAVAFRGGHWPPASR